MGEPLKREEDQPFGKENLGDAISRQVLEDTDGASKLDHQEDIDRQTAREFERKSRFGGEDEAKKPDQDTEDAKD